MRKLKILILGSMMIFTMSIAFANMPEVKYENLIAENSQVAEAEKPHKSSYKRSRIQRSIASENENTTEDRTKMLGYIFILSLPLFVGVWLMKKKVL